MINHQQIQHYFYSDTFQCIITETLISYSYNKLSVDVFNLIDSTLFSAVS